MGHKKGHGALSVGSVYESNYYGQVRVLEYHSSVNVVIEFVNTGNTYKVQKDALIKGLVKDSVQEKATNLEITSKLAAEKAEINRIKYEKEKAVRDERISEELRIRDSKRKERAEIIRKKRDAVMSVLYNSEEYGSYSITDFFANGNFEVTFKSTGGKSRHSMEVIESGRAKDPLRYSEEELAQQVRDRAADGYQKNRKVRLQQAKDYQRNNPEKARLRNRNRRAKRKSAEGTHTLAETYLILSEQNNKCAGCGCELDDTKHLDHFMPLHLGGSNSQENLQWLCQFCNNSKSAKEPSLWLYTIGTPEYQARRAAALAY